MMRKSLICLVLALGGCGQQASASPPVTAAAPPAAVASADPSAAALAQPGTPLPPTPVPATFDVAALADQVKPMVVNITTTHEVEGPQFTDPFEFFFGPGGSGRGGRTPDRRLQQTALGTGFIIDKAGYMITNEHVVHDADDVKVKLSDDRELKADVVGRDPKLDLALLKIQGAK